MMESSHNIIITALARRDTLKRSTFNYIKQILKDYPNIDRHIKGREEELRNPYHPTDINKDIRGGGQSDSMANMLITIDQDRRLAALERIKRVIGDNLQQADKYDIPSSTLYGRKSREKWKRKIKVKMN